MKNVIKSKNIKLYLLILFFIAINAIAMQSSFTKKKQCYFCNNQEIDLVTDAAKGIQEKLDAAKDTDRIVRTYRITGNDLNSVRTKVYHKTYRKKPNSYHQDFSRPKSFKNNTKNKTIEFIYKSHDKKHMTQILKEEKSKTIQKIDFPCIKKDQIIEQI